jgi:endonuclease/exonuclease/phosphatase (EEP) superfamily protein YafD
VATVALAPWTWFLLDDLGIRAELIGLALPAVGVAALALALGLSIPRRTRLAAVPMASLALMALCAVVLPWAPHDSEPPRDPLLVVAANVMGGWDGQNVADLTTQDAELLVVSEVSPPVDRQLVRAYPYRSAGTDLAVYSRLRLGPARPLPFLGANRARAVTVESPGGAFLLVAVHMPRPAPEAAGDHQVSYARHEELVSELASWIEEQELPVVLAGDLNVSDRGPSYHRLTDVTDDAMRSGWAGPTSLRWPQRLLLLRLDHIFVSEGWCWAGSSRFDLHGSDHRGVRATVGPCP